MDLKKVGLPSILISMETLRDSLSYLPSSEIAELEEALARFPRAGALLDHRKISDEAFLKRYPNAQKHPHVPHAFLYEKDEYPLGKSFLFDVGAFYLQDPSAMMPAFLLSPKPGEIVLDMCASPGGKSIGAHFLMGQEGILVSNDVSYPRALTLSQNLERFGVGNAIVTNEDLSLPHPSFEGRFDAILLDAPCSGMAMFRKNEAAKEEWSPAKVARFAEVQEKLLDQAASYLSPGGRFLYSTCSFAYEENEGQIRAFLQRHPEFKAMPLPIDDPSFFHGSAIPEAVTLFPHRFPGEGQFLCLLQKEGTAPSINKEKGRPGKKLDPLLQNYGLEGRHFEDFKGQIVSLPIPFDLPGAKILRKGLLCLDEKGKPCHALARFLPPEYALPLSEEQARLYLHGDAFPYPGEGYVVFRYENHVLGWAKIVNGMAKNHYPKGLRHLYPEL